MKRQASSYRLDFSPDLYVASTLYVLCGAYYYLKYQALALFFADTISIIFGFLGSLLFSLVCGVPAGAILGTIIGHFRAKTLPRAPDAEPEGFVPYQIGLIYAPLGLLVGIPLTWWLYPLFLEALTKL
ncbi:MAG: hypothetical protein MRJ96_00700 [Nitrospirales bacterium]|nr:hypothetical protein [Nitrospira sp.]MDR4499959.1 hypothetical protein [Nitrospirales bacterium]